jgi:hypothetical protein
MSRTLAAVLISCLSLAPLAGVLSLWDEPACGHCSGPVCCCRAGAETGQRRLESGPALNCPARSAPPAVVRASAPPATLTAAPRLSFERESAPSTLAAASRRPTPARPPADPPPRAA